ncbi:MAG TPA: hypothetical protein VHU88_18740 [Sporichthyaceae bacterium]|jgi:hypothetical protein|nr:hypothetical protein [Sporichthyaceae bacterium]
MVSSQFGWRCARPTAVLVLAAAPIGSGVPAFAAGTTTGDVPQIVAVTTAPLAVVLSGPKKHHSALMIRMRVTDPTGVDSVFAGVYGPSAKNGRAFRLKHVSGSNRDGMWQVKGSIPADGEPGSWRIQAFAVDTAQRSSDADDVYGNFAVRQASRFEHFAVEAPKSSGEPATPDPNPRTVDLRATLQRWTGTTWAAVPTAPVVVQFRAVGTTAFTAVETVKSDGDGVVAASEHSSSPGGAWRLSYAGDTTTAAGDSTDGALAPPPAPATPAPSAAPTVAPSTAPTAGPGPTDAPRAVPSGAPQRSRPTPTAEPTPVVSAAPPAPTTRPVPTASPAVRPTSRPYPTRPSGQPTASGAGAPTVTSDRVRNK